MKDQPQSQMSALSDEEIPRRHEEIRRALIRSNTATGVALLISIGLALAATFYAFLAEQHAREAREANERSREELRNSQLARAKALRFSGQVGRRQEGLDAIGQAVRIRPSPELRDEAIATLALVDIQPDSFWRTVSPHTEAQAFSLDGELYALGDRSGTVVICRRKDHQPVGGFARTHERVRALEFSADGSLLAARFERGALMVWEASTRQVVFEAMCPLDEFNANAFGFQPASHCLVVAASDSLVHVFDLDSRRELTPLKLFTRPSAMCFDVSGRRLAVATENWIRLWNFTTWEETPGISVDQSITHLAWHPDGRHFAVASAENQVLLLDSRTGSRKTLEGHTAFVSRVLFDPTGNLLVSSSWDGTSRFWDARSGRPLFVSRAGFAWAFDASGQRIAFYREGIGVGAWQPSFPTSFQTIAIPLGNSKRIYAVDFSADGKWLAAATSEGPHIFDRETGRHLDSAWLPRTTGLAFSGDGRALVTCGRQGLHQVPVLGDPSGHGATLGPPEGLGGPPGSSFGNAFPTRGLHHWLAVSGPSLAATVDLDPPRMLDTLTPPGAQSTAAISPDGRFFVSSIWKGGGTRVWDLQQKRPIAQWHDEGGLALFSPRGDWLVVGTSREFLFYETSSWQLKRCLERAASSALNGLGAFSLDGKLLALSHTLQQIRLVNPETGTTLATLDSPTPERITALSFSRDSTLLAAATDNGEVQLWNLSQLRRELAILGLDWEMPGEVPAPNIGAVGSRASPPDFFRHRNALWLSGVGAGLALLFALYSIQHHRQLVETYAATEAIASERRREVEWIRAQLTHSEKMKALGTLAAGIAHDFNNLLSVIRMAGQLVEREVKPAGVTKENLEDIQQAVIQGKDIVHSILGYSRPPGDLHQCYGLHLVVSDALAMLTKQFLSGIVLTLELDPHTPPVRGDRSRLEQIFLNLIVNAAEAMKGWGSLTVTVRSRPAAGNCLLPPRAAGQYVELRVRDSGPGIPPEILPRIFEPFFTTKQSGADRGTGLGLTTVYTIARQDGLGIDLKTEAGAGTVFGILVPVDA